MPYVEMQNRRIASYAEVERLMYFTDGRWTANRRLINRKLRLSRLHDGIALYFKNSRIMQWQPNDLLLLDGNSYFNATTRALFNTWLPPGIEICLAGDYWVIYGLNDPLGHTQEISLPYFHTGMVIDMQTKTEFSVPFVLTQGSELNNKIILQQVGNHQVSSLYCGPHRLRGEPQPRKKKG